MAIQILPEICISPPPPAEHFIEPFSPFDNIKFAIEEHEDNYRPALLSPPPTASMPAPKHLSPLSPEEVPVKGQGLERERFELLLKSSRERSAALGHRKAPDLRKELALKTYKSKQSATFRPVVSAVRHVDPLFPKQWNAVRASCSRWLNRLARPLLTNPRRRRILRRSSITLSRPQVSFLPSRCTNTWKRNV